MARRARRLRLEEVLRELNGSKAPSRRPPALTYLGSFLEQGDHHRRVSAAHRPVQGTHPAVVYVLYHGPLVNQELDLRRDRCVLRMDAEPFKEGLILCLWSKTVLLHTPLSFFF